MPLRFRRCLFSLVGLFLALALGACGDSGAGPGDSINASDQELAAISAAVLDARDRLAPELDTPDVIQPLQSRLTNLSAALLARRREATESELGAARAIMAASESTAPVEDAADRAAIQLALDQVQLLLQR